MENKKPDAGEVAPRPAKTNEGAPSNAGKSTKTRDKPADQGRSIPVQDLNSANDE